MEQHESLEDDLKELVQAWQEMSEKFHEKGFPEDAAAYRDCAEKLTEIIEQHQNHDWPR